MEAIEKILNKYQEDILRYERIVNELRSKVSFYTSHKLEEELRITNIKLGVINDLFYDFRNMHDELKEIVN